ncbi:MAG: hypothetical protein K2H85_02080, partial [Allobaculum sp.]|nr:hypothetical protein [Allobaculum sp.]
SVNSLNSINSEVDQKISKDVVPPTPTQETGDTNEDSIEVSIESDTKVVSPLPNTSYTIVAEIGSLDMTPIALNSDCWVIKKGNEFQFLFPDGSTKKLDSKDQLILQVNTDYTGNTTLLSSACLIESSSQDNNQYYPKEEEISSCLPSSSEKTSYPLEGNYQNNTVPVLVRSSNQSGYWIYNPASKALYGPFKDSEDTSFYSKVSRLSDITLVGHNGQIGGPYWTPMGSTVQKTTKNEKTQSLISDSKDTDSELISKESKALNNSKESTATNQKNTNTEELKIWSKDGTSYRTGYTNPKAVDWYTVGAFQADQFHLLDENLEIVYAGPFDQGGSVINSVAPVQINGVWKLVQFKNVPSSGPVTNYSFTNTDKEESNTSSNPSTSVQEKKSTDDVKSDSSTNTSSTLK